MKTAISIALPAPLSCSRALQNGTIRRANCLSEAGLSRDRPVRKVQGISKDPNVKNGGAGCLVFWFVCFGQARYCFQGVSRKMNKSPGICRTSPDPPLEVKALGKIKGANSIADNRGAFENMASFSKFEATPLPPIIGNLSDVCMQGIGPERPNA